jgi:1-deoxy-D-xylulose-5-phosphate reductoisomerase
MHSVVILGSSGSIGENTLEICRRFDIEVEALAVGSNIESLAKQIELFSPRYVAVADESAAAKLDFPRIFSGEDAALRMLEHTESPLVVNAMVGYAGLAPTLRALEMGREVALANKESLVAAGAFLDRSGIIPIDSEHFGLWYLLGKRRAKALYITASGGALRDMPLEELYRATYREALAHPNWSMGEKITIDSASMMNKLFELLEARWLFDTGNIDAFIERSSLIHAMVQFPDGSMTAHLAGTDMKLPIAFALRGEVDEEIVPPLDPLSIAPIEFEEIDKERYPLWELREEILSRPKMGAVLNAANEVAMERFRQGESSFGEFVADILEIYGRFSDREPESIDEVFEIDREVRAGA